VAKTNWPPLGASSPCNLIGPRLEINEKGVYLFVCFFFKKGLRRHSVGGHKNSPPCNLIGPRLEMREEGVFRFLFNFFFGLLK
jgi:hypothetical protein